jgi:thiol-disulfide isomerase/thioredoxin
LPLALVLASACSGGVSSVQTATLLQPVPVTLPRDDGVPTAIPVAGARAVVLDFWSPTCAPCKRTIPAVLARRAEIEAKGAVHVLVCVLETDETVEDARTVLSLWGISEPFLVDRSGAFLSKVGARDVPAFAIIDAAGILQWVAPDGVTIKDVIAAIP